MAQEERARAMRQLEVRTDILVPNGFQEVELLKNIGEAIAKVEMVAEMLPAKGMFASTIPPPATATPGRDDLAVFASFDAVDRNLAHSCLAGQQHVSGAGGQKWQS
jgi:hypothetical protein